MEKSSQQIETKLIHAGEPEPRVHGAVSMPIFQSAMFESQNETNYHAIRYIRLNNTPNQVVLNNKLAALENAQAALVTSSGMAAITTALLTVLRTGDHLLAQECLYGGTHDFITKDLVDFGISYDFINTDEPNSWASKLRPNTKAIYVETITNPLVQVGDQKSVVSFAKENKLVSLIDNTFASPINFRPCEWGFDLSLHSCTKYINGHSDIVAGAVIGRADLVEKITHRLNHLGGSLDPHACFLLHRGLKTLALRVRWQNESAHRLAQFLSTHPAVERVNYPGLKNYPQHQRAKELLNGFGGMLSFELRGGLPAAEAFIAKARIPLHAPSLGSVETLMVRPAATSHVGMAKQDREKLGISEGLVRISVGIESTEDLLADFAQALAG